MILNICLTRVVNDGPGKQYGFGITRDNKTVYVPGLVVDLFDLEREDMGTWTEADVFPDPNMKSDYVANTLVLDCTLVEALRSEIEELRNA